MRKTDGPQVCFPSSDGTKLLCNCVDRNGDGQLWETASGKWIPIPIENAPAVTSAFSKNS
jgi:hypothetical protein